MSEFVANKINPDNINEGRKFNKGDGINPNDLNKMVEGIVYASENGGSGLTTEEKEKVDKLVIDGTGNKFLADDGEYKEVGGSDLDVQINGTSIVENGVANIPLNTKVDKKTPTTDSLYATTKSKGDILIRVANTDNGVAIYNNQDLGLLPATEAEISAKKLARKAITLSRLDYAVKVGLTTNTLTLTDTEKANAQNWLGVKPLAMYSIDIYRQSGINFYGDEAGGFNAINIVKSEKNAQIPYIAPFTLEVYDDETDEVHEETHIGIYLWDTQEGDNASLTHTHFATTLSCFGVVANQAFLSISDNSFYAGNYKAYDQITYLSRGEWITVSLDDVFDDLLPIEGNWHWQDEWGNQLEELKIPLVEL